ncbi:GNAT family N-acetyltransferase [Hoeflea sp. WL0058]|uniref:GNAT family N-acetyltransferase n=1 Tax=Flavimaribacter sediminis TaxID=2865987 RepID=A0AAE3D0I0_9HYPH|nr:GNAT family N-acetyltransferase [Flavimaribacter sediminis]MBW8638525.1 GNAT family N-acetyltransferase [Flavimaribacter sediminis]
MDISVRQVAPRDLERITEIYRESVLNGVATYELTPPDFQEMQARYTGLVESGFPYLVAETPTGELAGYAYAGPYRTRPAYRWTVEDSIYLPPQSRGKGVGKALLAALVERSADLGFRQMIAVIGGASPASVALHRALGFQLTGAMKATGFKHGRWLDTTIMQLPLGEGQSTDPDANAYPGTLFREV